MSWHIGKQKVNKPDDFNKILRTLDDKDLDEHTARITFAKFVKANLGFAVHFFTGIELLPAQELLLKGMLIADNSLIVASRGVGKCIKWDSLVLTESGFKKICDVNIGEKIHAKNSLQTVLGKTENPIEDGFRVISNKRFEFEGKIGHRSLIFNKENCSFEYKHIEDLKVGDLLVLKRGMDVWGSKDIFDGYDFRPTNLHQLPFIPKNEIDFYYFFGLFLGDGHYDGRVVGITSNDEEIKSFVVQKFKEYFPKSTTSIANDVRTTAQNIHVSSVLFGPFLRHLGYDVSARAITKKIPEPILSCKKEYIAAVLRGLFDTDGWICLRVDDAKNSQTASLGLSSSSFELIKQVQHILLNFGVVSLLCNGHKGGKFKIRGVECNTSPAWKLNITGFQNVNQFYKEIGFGLSRKSLILKKFIEEYKKDNDFNSYLLPVGGYLKKKYTGAHFRGIKVPKEIEFSLHPNLSIGRIEHCLKHKFFDEKDTKFFQEIIDEQLIFEPIREIVPVKVKTYDIQVDKEECYWANGFIHHNTYILALFALFYPIFYPNSKIVCVSANFRSSRRILEMIDKVVKTKKGSLLASCFSSYNRRPDEHKLKLNNGSEIIALPLSGEGIRGQRSSCLLVDEGLLISKEIQESIIRPFLTAKQNYQEEKEIKDAENELIRRGVITEKDRMSFPKNKYMVFSSASYEFQYLYEMYKNYIHLIENPPKDDPDPARYFVARLSYLALPEDSFLDLTQIKASAQAIGESSDYFKREYMAQFSSAGDNYFNPQKMHECTVPVGEHPVVQLKGDKDTQYLLIIDPSYSASKASDYFAMGVYMLIPQERKIVLVHTYAKAGGELKEHFEYLTYLLTFFNIVWITLDNSGSEFIHGYNESTIAKERNLKLEFFSDDIDLDKDENYVENISKAKREYNQTSRRYVYGQNFTSDSLRRMNEYLQNQIEAKKIWFASKVCPNDEAFKRAEGIDLPFKFKNKDDLEYDKLNFLEDQDGWIDETKVQTALIEVKSSPLGTLSFDLPQNIRRSDNPNRPRKDLYTCLLMANYTSKHYYNMVFDEGGPVYAATFEPIIIR